MAFKILSSLQAVGQPAAADYPGGAYRIRVEHFNNFTTLGTYCAGLIAAGRYPLPYIEVPYTAGPATSVNEYLYGWVEDDWTDLMTTLAEKLGSVSGAGVEYIEFANEVKHVSTVASYRNCWDTYIRAMEISAPIFRAQGVAFMCSSLGFTRYEKEFMDYLASKAAFRLFDAKAIHCYTGGTHADGSAALGTPADAQKRLEDGRAALNSAGPGHPEMDLFQTEMGWPGVPAVSTGTVTSGSNVITGVADTTDFVTGRPVRATGIPTTATLASKTVSTLTLTSGIATSTPTTNPATKIVGGQKVTDPSHQTHSNEATQATHITNMFGRVYGASPAPGFAKTNRVRMWSIFTSTDYSPASAPTATGEYTEGAWPLYCGLKYENSPNVSQAYTNAGGTGHKASWAAFDAIADGLGTSGVKPTPVTGAASAITNTTATIAATVDPNNLDTDWYIQYGPDANFGKQTSIQNAGAGASPVAVSRNLTGLTAGQTYHYRVVAWNDAGTSWGAKDTFVATGAIGATIYTTPPRSGGAGANPVAANEVIPGTTNPPLLPGTQYFYRLKSTNSAGSSTGAQQQFTTQAAPTTPVVTTGTATSIGLTTVTLNGIVDPNGIDVSYFFEWGLTPEFGNTSTSVAVSGDSPISVSFGPTGLTPDTTYYYHLAISGVEGGTKTFTTLAPGQPPVLEPPGPSLDVSVEIRTADGRLYRWDPDDANPRNRPYELQFSTAAGDGFAEASCVVYRPIDLDWPDLALLTRGRFVGADSSTAYEGRVAGMPRSVDDTGEKIQVQFQGLMSSTRDRPFMQVYCDRSGDRWQEAPMMLRLAYATAAKPLDVDYIPQVDTGSLSFKGSGSTVSAPKKIEGGSQANLIWMAPAGCRASVFSYRGDDKGAAGNATFTDEPFLFAADIGVLDGTKVMGPTDWDFYSLTLDNTLRITGTLTPPRRLLGLKLRAKIDHDPGTANAPHRIFRRICVYGDNDVPRRDNGDEPKGVFASDVMRDIIEAYCPLLDASALSPTETMIEHLVFDTPTAPFDALTLLNGYHLYLLGAWEKGKVQFEPADLTKADYLVQKTDDGVTLDLHGDTIDEVANGIVVSYTDIDDRAQVLMPKDAAGTVLYEELVDANPDNPANREGTEKWITLELSNPATKRMAVALGQVALQEHNRPKSPGTVTISSGYVKDVRQNLQPAYKVRYGQTLSITDLPNEAPRLITATSWSEDGQLTITLEQPPTRVDAVLARLELSQSVRGIG